MTTREALGLFGRYDYLSDEMNGHVDYFEFIKIMFGESESTITGTAQSTACAHALAGGCAPMCAGGWV